MHTSAILLSVTQLVIQLAIIIIASWVSRRVSNVLKIPQVIGYIITGLVLGPFVLGSIALLPPFSAGLFPLIESPIHVSPYLYGLSTIAAVILLFLSGLETDMALFIKYSFIGSIVGLGGLVVSFAGGYFASFLLTSYHALHPIHLFMGTIATATSVGISTTVLSSKYKINSPEGVTILSAAVLDDVLGIIILSIVVGLSETLMHNMEFTAVLTGKIIFTSLKTIGIWLACTLLGIIFSRKLGKGMKYLFKDSTSITILSLGFALLLGGLFEMIGLSMVIGAYIIGLTLSNTDLSYVIQEKMAPISKLFIPIFFIISGMSIDLSEILQWDTFVIGTLYALICIIAKVLGAGLPALLLGFNSLGALRIGFGMVPRGEIALIIAGIGITSGIIDNQMFGAILIMVVVSSLVAPFILDRLLQIQNSGTKKKIQENLTRSEFDFKNETLARLIIADFLQLLELENFYANKIIRKNKHIYHIRKDNLFLTLTQEDNTLVFITDQQSKAFIKTALYEASANIAESAQAIKKTLNPEYVLPSETSSHNDIVLNDLIASSLVTLQINSTTKKDIIHELCDLLDQDGVLTDKNTFFKEVLEREKTFSTGMQSGIAIPHAKSNCVANPAIVIGLKPEGVDFDSLDGKPSTIFVLIATPKDAPHLSILTKISTLLNKPEFREEVLACKKKIDIIKLFST